MSLLKQLFSLIFKYKVLFYSTLNKIIFKIKGC